jgi:hypothetical protein
MLIQHSGMFSNNINNHLCNTSSRSLERLRLKKCCFANDDDDALDSKKNYKHYNNVTAFYIETVANKKHTNTVPSKISTLTFLFNC